MLILIGVCISLLSVLVLLLVCYHAREDQQPLEQVRQQQGQQQQGASTANASTGAAATQAGLLLKSAKHPTPSVIIRNLPVIKYQPLGTGSTQVCAICYEDFHADEDIKLLPCRHSYHGACIDAWLNRSHRCPMCNSDVMQAASLPAVVTVEEASGTPAAPSTTPHVSFRSDSPAHQQQQQRLEVVVIPDESRARVLQSTACLTEQQRCLECQHQQQAAAGLAA